MRQVLGLSDKQELLYRHLLLSGYTSRDDLTALFGEDAELDLRELRSRGLIHSDPPVARRPSAALQRDLLHSETRFRALHAAVEELDELYRDSHPVEVLSSLTRIQWQFEEIHATARQEVMQLVTHPFIALSDPDGPAMSADADEDHPAKCRIVYEREVFDNAVAVAGLAHSAGRGCEIRLAERLPHKLLIGDRMVAMTPRYPRGHHDGSQMLLVHPGTLLDFLVAVFEAEWERAMPLQTDPGWFTEVGRSELDADERLIVEMLSRGVNVERIAAALRVHKRTVDRRVEDLKRRAGVTTLFQLGGYAARNWTN
ncbi:helix-turn-helix transcriptional regulator (plasmid) [Microtetraspora malaysiensis]|uniref:helix-turn-helix transcriptional regulator n=1 Tax=Microtetraspora malaysiensis TaxID=161358 RepID=UPI003D8C5184